MTSLQLLARFHSANDFSALMELYNRHHDKLVKWVRSRYGVDKSIAENVVIETFEQVRDKEYDSESFDDWLYSLAGNCVAAVKARIERQRHRAALSESWLESLPFIQQQALSVLFNDLPQDIAAEVLELSTDELGEITDNALAALDCGYQLVAA